MLWGWTCKEQKNDTVSKSKEPSGGTLVTSVNCIEYQLNSDPGSVAMTTNAKNEDKHDDDGDDTCPSYLPTWISNTEIDPQWIEQVTTLRGVVRCSVDDISNQGRRREEIRNGSTLRLHITYEQEETSTHEDGQDQADVPNEERPKTLVIKQVPPAGRTQSQMLGLAREALFYQKLAPQIGLLHSIPKIYYSIGDMESGSKLVLMEDLSNASYLDSGILFGPGNPNNWDRDLPSCIAKAYHLHSPEGGSSTTTTSSSSSIVPSPPTSAQVARDTFVAIAQIHATFWKHSELFVLVACALSSVCPLDPRVGSIQLGTIAGIYSRNLARIEGKWKAGYGHCLGSLGPSLCRKGHARHFVGIATTTIKSTIPLDLGSRRLLAR